MSNAALPVLSGDSSLSGYINQISKFPYLTQEEETILAKKLHEEGDVNAAHTLVTSHLRLVVKIAAGFRNYGLPIMELVAEGNIGLMHAVRKFDYTKGFRLSTYAMWWIKASMQEYILHSWSLVKIGTTAAQKKLFFNLRKMKNRLDKVDNSLLSPKEVKKIAMDLDVSECEVLEMDSRLTQSDKSLNDPVIGMEDDSAEMIEYITDDSREDQELTLVKKQEFDRQHNLLLTAMQSLNDREREIIMQRRMKDNPATLDDLSQQYKISRERVRQIENRALEKLKIAVTSCIN
jgi:RNA polymerase sigma-32 factor